MRTPLLLVCGDDTASVADALCFLTALRQRQSEVELVVYRGEGHTLTNPANRRDLEDRCVAWFRRHDPGRDRNVP